jgi:ketosteroid isomerase-like protein
MRTTLTLLVCALTLLGCATTSTTLSNDADAYIRDAGPRFTNAFSSGDWDTVVSFYADDAVVLPPHGEIARGPAGARQAFAMLAPMRPNLSIAPDRIVQSCDLAFEYGTYQMRFTPPGASTVNDRGKYVTIWRRTPAGDWKIIGDMFNTSLPAPGI